MVATVSGGGVDSGVEWQCRLAVVDVLLSAGFASRVTLGYIYNMFWV